MTTIVVFASCVALAAPPALTTVGGESYRLPAGADCRANVLIFVGHDCPISNAYAPEVRRLCEAYKAKGVSLAVVYPEPDLGRADAARHAAEFAFPCVALHDPAGTLTKFCGAKTMPEAVVLTPAGDVVYRGRIDDRFAGFGKGRPVAAKTELRDALDAVLAGRPVAVPRAAAVGCDIPARRD